jgi:sulfonate transport system substrate-binding protein
MDRMKSLLKRLATLVVAGGLAASLATVGHAEDKTIRIGFQKYGTLVLLKSKGLLEEKLKPLGWSVAWTEFPAGPQLLEALNVGAIDFGTTGEAPPIFAQAAGAPLVYVGYEPAAPKGEAILVPHDSRLKTVADLKGKTVALNKGSNVHYLLVKVLEQAGLKYSDIKTSFLPPADARAAFERGAVDAWAIWDPFLAAAEAATGARQLADGTEVVSNHQFYLASRAFTEAHADIVKTAFDALGTIDDWVRSNPKEVAAEFSPALGIPAPILEVAVARQGYGIKPIDDAVVAKQQKIADTFFALGLIPKAIKITDAVRKPQS